MKFIAKQWRRQIVSLVVLLLPASGLAGTVLQWSFDGTNGNSLTASTDTVGGVTVSKFNDSGLSGGATNLVKYGPPNPWYNTNGTSANFLNTVAVNDPGVALFKTDTGANSTLDLTGTSSLTIEAFVYLYDLRQAVVIRKTDGGANGYYIDVRSTGNFGFRAGSTEAIATAAITTNTWYHVALVRDGVSNQARFYINSSLTTTIGLSGSMPDTPNALGIGAIVRDNLNPPGNSGQFFHGRIDEVRISDTALAPSEFLVSQAVTNVVPPGVIVFDKTETFDTANSAAGHGWLELGSRTNGQNYGFSATTNAGGLAGEAGGSMSRKALRSSYCDVFSPPLGLDNVIRASGRFMLTAVPSSGNASVLCGHGDSTKTGLNNEANQMGLVLATSPPSFYSHITFADGFRWEENVASGLTVNQVYAWDYEYDPADNGGLGSFATRITALGSGITNYNVRYLDASLRNRGAQFNSFGITQRGLSDLTPAPISQSFIDDVTYSAASNGPSVQFTASTSSILETAGSGVLNVTLSQVFTQTVTVQYSVTGGNATGDGDDYTLASGLLTFLPGITNRSIPFSVIADGLTEPDETIEVSLAAPTVVGLGARFKHNITIINVDLLKLHLEMLNQNLTLKWPVSFWNYRLQSRSNLTSSSWTDVTNSVEIANNWRQVVLSPTNTGGFFRLAQNLGELPTFTNSIGMKMVQLPAGVFTMGYWQSTPLANAILDVEHWVPSLGDFDEKPSHQVTISRPFWIGAYEVSNLEYEQFDPAHATLRGKLGFSTNNNEAVVYVSWTEAKAFCDWLSAREGRSYRLPTEAEWEYACRAGTTTHFFTGDTLPSQYLNNPDFSWWPTADSPTDVFRGQMPPNQWGLHDMHGNVEEWCSDWYGPYAPDAQTDPVGRADGLAKVTRGGSHSTVAFYLRSANRMGTLPEDKSWYIGLRVVIGDTASTSPLPATPPNDYQLNVSQSVPSGITNGPNPALPYFNGPLQYVKIPAGSFGLLYSTHNHDAGGIVECPNGDLLAMWYTCVTEQGRELALAASRLRYGSTNWDNASFFYDMPDRNDHAPCLGFDGEQTLYHFVGLSAAATWGPMALTLRTSTDNGASWTAPRIISPEHNVWHQPIASFSKTANGTLIVPSDAATGGTGGSVIWKSRDNGLTWFNPAIGRPTPSFTQGNTGAWIAGIHAPVAELSDGRLIAFGRGNNIGGMMPKSISSDGGTNWTYSASVFPPIGGGQRATMLRLKEGPLFLSSFGAGMSITDASGGTRTVSGLFAALSYDGGVTWPCLRLISDDGPGRSVETTDGTAFTMSFSSAEPRGYITSTQGKNNIIHLISSRQHYQFNLKWLETRPPSAPASP